MEGVTVRCDSGVVEGSDISMYYDPMISKLVTYAETREKAIEGMSAAVDDYVIRGVGHNTPFIASVCRNDFFKRGDTPTSFIDTHYPDGFQGVELDKDETTALAVSAAAIAGARRYALERPPLPKSAAEARREAAYGEEHVVVTLGGKFGDSFAVALTGGDAALVTPVVDGKLDGEPEAVAVSERARRGSEARERKGGGGPESAQPRFRCCRVPRRAPNPPSRSSGTWTRRRTPSSPRSRSAAPSRPSRCSASPTRASSPSRCTGASWTAACAACASSPSPGT
jgi:hypothetical protein